MRTSTKVLIAAGAGLGGYLVWKKLIVPEMARREAQARIDSGQQIIADNFPPEVLQLAPMEVASPAFNPPAVPLTASQIASSFGTGSAFRNNLLPFARPVRFGR